MNAALKCVAVAAVAGLALGQEPVISPEKEAAIARQYAVELRRQTTPLPIPEVLAYVERVGRRLAGGFRDGIVWTFELTAEESETEPVGAPGGLVLVPAGAILRTADEESFVRALAHAMAHVAGRLFVRSASGSIPLLLVGHGRNVLAPRAVGEELEREAGALAADALAKTGAITTGEYAEIQEQVRAKLNPPKPARRPPTLHRK
jgi:predicted Zn-dependent protease